MRYCYRSRVSSRKRPSLSESQSGLLSTSSTAAFPRRKTRRSSLHVLAIRILYDRSLRAHPVVVLSDVPLCCRLPSSWLKHKRRDFDGLSLKPTVDTLEMATDAPQTMIRIRNYALPLPEASGLPPCLLQVVRLPSQIMLWLGSTMSDSAKVAADWSVAMPGFGVRDP